MSQVAPQRQTFAFDVTKYSRLRPVSPPPQGPPAKKAKKAVQNEPKWAHYTQPRLQAFVDVLDGTSIPSQSGVLAPIQQRNVLVKVVWDPLDSNTGALQTQASSLGGGGRPIVLEDIDLGAVSARYHRDTMNTEDMPLKALHRDEAVAIRYAASEDPNDRSLVHNRFQLLFQSAAQAASFLNLIACVCPFKAALPAKPTGQKLQQPPMSQTQEHSASQYCMPPGFGMPPSQAVQQTGQPSSQHQQPLMQPAWSQSFPTSQQAQAPLQPLAAWHVNAFLQPPPSSQHASRTYGPPPLPPPSQPAPDPAKPPLTRQFSFEQPLSQPELPRLPHLNPPPSPTLPQPSPPRPHPPSPSPLKRIREPEVNDEAPNATPVPKHIQVKASMPPPPIPHVSRRFNPLPPSSGAASVHPLSESAPLDSQTQDLPGEEIPRTHDERARNTPPPQQGFSGGHTPSSPSRRQFPSSNPPALPRPPSSQPWPSAPICTSPRPSVSFSGGPRPPTVIDPRIAQAPPVREEAAPRRPGAESSVSEELLDAMRGDPQLLRNEVEAIVAEPGFEELVRTVQGFVRARTG